MKGTEKQIKWAEQIKAEKIEYLKDRLNQMIKENKSAPADQIDKIKNQCQMAIEEFDKQDDSKFWIDNRNLLPQQIAKHILNLK